MLADLMPKLAQFDAEEDHPYSERASIAGPERCTRSMVYWGLNYPKTPLPGRAILVFEDSSWHEELTLDRLRGSAYHVHSEQLHLSIPPVDPAVLDFLAERVCGCGQPVPAYHVAGHIDGLITDMTGGDSLLEHKAINHFTFNRYWAGEIPMDYVTQVCLYLRGLYLLNRDLRTGILLIKNKNTAQFMEYLIQYNYAEDRAAVVKRVNSLGQEVETNLYISGVCDSAFRKFREVRDCINERRLPKRQYEMNHYRCDYCNYSGPCWESYEQEFAKLATGEELTGELEELIRYRMEVKGHLDEMEKEEDGLKKKIVNLLKEKGVREGKAGVYVVKLNLRKRHTLDASLIPDQYRQIAEKTVTWEELRVTKPKKGVDHG
jgi:hypothetical protein